VAASLDDMASRARLSALLPQLRLRATRLIDESTSLSPTSYDPERTTSSGGASLWLEARTTWSLDRLLFANEEVRIERMHHQLRDEATVLRRRVLDQLFRWQAARVAMADPMIAPRACVELWLEAEQAAIVLDVETAGWFAKWRALRAIAPVDCEADVVAPEVDLRDMDPAPAESSDDATDRRSGKRGARARQTNAR
jgi:hypothetical protein